MTALTQQNPLSYPSSHHQRIQFDTNTIVIESSSSWLAAWRALNRPDPSKIFDKQDERSTGEKVVSWMKSVGQKLAKQQVLSSCSSLSLLQVYSDHFSRLLDGPCSPRSLMLDQPFDLSAHPNHLLMKVRIALIDNEKITEADVRSYDAELQRSPLFQRACDITAFDDPSNLCCTTCNLY